MFPARGGDGGVFSGVRTAATRARAWWRSPGLCRCSSCSGSGRSGVFMSSPSSGHRDPSAGRDFAESTGSDHHLAECVPGAPRGAVRKRPCFVFCRLDQGTDVRRRHIPESTARGLKSASGRTPPPGGDESPDIHPPGAGGSLTAIGRTTSRPVPSSTSPTTASARPGCQTHYGGRAPAWLGTLTAQARSPDASASWSRGRNGRYPRPGLREALDMRGETASAAGPGPRLIVFDAAIAGPVGVTVVHLERLKHAHVELERRFSCEASARGGSS